MLWLCLIAVQQVLVVSQTNNSMYDIPERCLQTCSAETCQEEDVDIISQSCAKFYPSCDDKSMHAGVSYHWNKISGLATYKITFKNSKEGCWGCLITVYEDNSWELANYISYEQIIKTNGYFFPYKPSAGYLIYLTPLPYGKKRLIFDATSPSRCEGKALQHTAKAKSFQSCSRLLGATEILKILRPVCRHFSDVIDDVLGFLNSTNVTADGCAFESPKSPAPMRTETEVEKKQNFFYIVVATSVFILLLVILFTVSIIIRRKRRFLRVPSTFERQNVFAVKSKKNSETNHNGEAPTVMLLHRPGCELLDTLMRDVAFVLTTCNIKVKLALLEQSEVDAEGGISSYLQRNIDTSDFILIMFAPHQKQTRKHLPYEFALKVISGLAYHHNDCSKYLPIYLANYNETINIIPSYLIALQDCGFHIPKDMKILIEKIVGHKLLITNELQTKMCFFSKKIETTCSKFKENHHHSCCKEDCDKGAISDSISNLSSIWASSKYSKWSPVSSVNVSKENIMNNADQDGLLKFKRDWV